MENIYYLLIVCLVCWYFVFLRKVSESAKKHANSYCQKEQLQFIALARRSSRFTFSKHQGFYLASIFDFEFSGDGESSYQGQLFLQGLKLDQVVLPPYRV